MQWSGTLPFARAAFEKPAFCDRLKQTVSMANLSLEEAADLVGAAPGTLSMWMSGRAQPPEGRRERVLHALFQAVATHAAGGYAVRRPHGVNEEEAARFASLEGAFNPGT